MSKKLGPLLKQCKEHGVKRLKLKLGEVEEIEFFSNEPEKPLAMHPLDMDAEDLKNYMIPPKLTKEEEEYLQKAMLHMGQ